MSQRLITPWGLGRESSSKGATTKILWTLLCTNFVITADRESCGVQVITFKLLFSGSIVPCCLCFFLTIYWPTGRYKSVSTASSEEYLRSEALKLPQRSPLELTTASPVISFWDIFRNALKVGSVINTVSTASLKGEDFDLYQTLTGRSFLEEGNLSKLL